MAPETVKQVKDLMSAIEAHYETQVGAIDAALAVNLRDHGWSGVEKALEAKRKIQSDVKDAATFKLKGRLKEAEAREAAVAAEAVELQAQQAAEMKARALVAWTKVGGGTPEFEQAYPAIRSKVLQDESIRNMNRKPVASKIRL